MCYKEEKGRGGDTTPLTHKAFMETLSAELLGRPLRNPPGQARAERLVAVIADPVPGKVAGLVSSAGRGVSARTLRGSAKAARYLSATSLSGTAFE